MDPGKTKHILASRRIKIKRDMEWTHHHYRRHRYQVILAVYRKWLQVAGHLQELLDELYVSIHNPGAYVQGQRLYTFLGDLVDTPLDKDFKHRRLDIIH